MGCIVLAHDRFMAGRAKTAEALLRYGRDPVLAVVDRAAGEGRTADEVVGPRGACVPVLGGVAEALELAPDTLCIGVAPVGGRLPADWKAEVALALRAGVHVTSGLHDFLADDPGLAGAAADGGARIWDVRRPPPDKPIYSGRILDAETFVVHTVGTDCSSGKMTTAVEVVHALGERGVRAAFVATGQTGIMIGCDAGVVVDAVVSDFVAGWTERACLDAFERTRARVLVVEGQGAVTHPAYAGVTVALLHGCSPHACILCHDASRPYKDAPFAPPHRFPVLDPSDEWPLVERMASAIRTPRLLGVSVMRGPWKPARDLGVPVADVFAGGAATLADSIVRAMP